MSMTDRRGRGPAHARRPEGIVARNGFDGLEVAELSPDLCWTLAIFDAPKLRRHHPRKRMIQ
jgi:hypothetical protein